MMRRYLCCALYSLAGFLVACAPPPTPAVVTPPEATGTSAQDTAVATWTPTPAPTIESTPTSTLAPTIDPASVDAVASRGLARMDAAGIEPLCLRWEDVDGDGEAEWVGLHHRTGDPPRLQAFVLDGDDWYDLLPLAGETYGLGEYATCELEIRDINVDGRTEILIRGHAGTSTDLLHIYVWDGAAYSLLAPFEGEAGVRVTNADGDLTDEISVRYDVTRNLVWEAVYTWDGANYGWTWERYTWRYLDRPRVYVDDTPEHAVISFYLAIDDRDIPAAYALLSAEARAAQPYSEWAAGFATTVAAEVGSVHEVEGGEERLVVAQVRAYDNVDGRVIATLWDVQWTVVWAADGWRLGAGRTTQVDQWELSYYP